MSLYEKIYRHLLDEIKKGKLQPGDRVPSESELSTQFSVSRITSKKALEMLANEKWIERVRGKGSYVSMNFPMDRKEEGSSNRREVETSSEPKIISLILPDFDQSFGLKMVRGIEERCSSYGIPLMLKLTYDKRNVEEEAIRASIRHSASGMIVFPVHGAHYNAELLRLMLDGFPIVLVDRYLRGIAATAVYTDNRKASQELTEYLLDQGHREIAFISPPSENTSTIEDRIQGYLSAFTQRGIPANPDMIVTNLYSTLPIGGPKEYISNDYGTLQAFIDKHPRTTAFLACEYLMAVRIAEWLNMMGKRVPGDYEIVCFDYPEDSFDRPMFTHIRQDEWRIGQRAVDLLTAQWSGEAAPEHHLVEHKLIRRPIEIKTSS
ncbi:GntR family transcriptional regulator [Paenibacillus sp. GCM10023248]|uniref:GntR family transcriptional regulator n=1 Tax=unclassified Paenibacillus TaxID=185978 RepID=UPI00237946DB|nr:GntR family transcriptional regulator [Paenibacillus sp. MAHUQ-63]MDD9268430.1 GntR family transcriptional regulator [Paenibacillus sp. MAHUQ-63]